MILGGNSFASPELYKSEGGWENRCVMAKNENNFAYIDGANLHKGVADLGWALDYKRFRVWLKDKYNIETAYLFIGLIPGNKDLYTKLQEMGYVLVYKEVTYDGAGKVKGTAMPIWF